MIGYDILDEIALLPDASGNGAHIEAPNTAFDDGRYVTTGNALVFDGSTQAVDLSEGTGGLTHDAFTDRTVSFHFKADTSGSGAFTRTLYEEGDDAGDAGFAIRLVRDGSGNYFLNVRVNVGDGPIDLLVDSSADLPLYNPADWHHLVFVFDYQGTFFSGLYLDAAIAYTPLYDQSITWSEYVPAEWDMPERSGDAGMGFTNGEDVYGSTAANYFKGLIDDLRIYDVAMLNFDHILALKEGRELNTVNTPTAPPAPLAHWKLDSAIDAVSIDDRTTTYGYGENNSGTKQTSKTVTKTIDSTVVEQDTYEYDPAGRMTEVTVDKTPSGGSSTTTAYEYDHNNLRVSETTGSETKNYLFDTQNPTGYSQVLEEYVNNVLDRTYALGMSIISQHDSVRGVLTFLLDAQRNTRALLDDSGNVMQHLAYNGLGQLLEGEGLTPLGEAWTSFLHHQEFRALDGRTWVRDRWVRDGIFFTKDNFRGISSDPLTYHSYLAFHANSIMNRDPSGLITLQQSLATVSVSTILGGSFGFLLTGSVKGTAYGALGGLSFGTSVALILANPTNLAMPQLKGQDFGALAFSGLLGAMLGFVDYVIETGGQSTADDRAWESTIRGFATATTGFATSYGTLAVLPHWSAKVNALVSHWGPREVSAAGAFIGTIASVTASGKIIQNPPRALLDILISTGIAYAAGSIEDTVLTNAIEGYAFSLVAKLSAKVGIGYIDFIRDYAQQS